MANSTESNSKNWALMPKPEAPVTPSAQMKAPRHKSLTSPILSPQDIAAEILERSQRKQQQRLPERGDVIFTMKLTQRLAKRVVRTENAEVGPGKAAKTEPKTPDLDARELLAILQDGAESHYLEKSPAKPKTPRLARGPYKNERQIDPELEKKLALQQLMEFSRKRGRPKKESNNNEVAASTSEEKGSKKRKAENRELQSLLQDEGAINMLYAIRKGDSESKDGLLPSKRRMKKALLRKAQEVKEALLGGTSTPAGLNLRHRNCSSDAKHRKSSIDSIDSEQSVQNDNFTFASPAEASKIIRRHSSSSSYSSRSNSPRRISIERDRSPPGPRLSLERETPTVGKPANIKVSERAERLIELKCKELKLQPEHSEMIKKLIQQKKNGLKERLQSEFATKLKVAPSASEPVATDEVSSTEKGTPPKASPTNSYSSPSAKPVWKMLEEDWSTEDVELDSPSLAQPSPPHTLATNQTPIVNSTQQPTSTEDIKLKDGDEFLRRLESSSQTYKELYLRRVEHLVHVEIAPVSTYLPQAFNAQVLREMTTLFEELSQDSKCRAILLTSRGNLFSNGLDIPALLHQTVEMRKTVAFELANALKQFVFKLCMMRKPVIAGVSGEAIGFGVVILAYCDQVIATEEASFYTPYTRLGYLPEAAATVALPHAIGNRWANNMLMGCMKLDAQDAHLCGLISRLVPKESFHQELMASSTAVSKQSPQSMESSKALLLHNLRSRIASVLSLEVSLLQQHWITEECQTRMRDHPNNLRQ